MDVSFVINVGDVSQKQADVLALKYAQHLYGADRLVAGILGKDDYDMQELLPNPGSYVLLPTPPNVILSASNVLFISVPHLNEFRYAEIRRYAADVLRVLAKDAPLTQHLTMTIHGVGSGLDEAESLRSQLAGFIDAFNAGQYPPYLKRISIVEHNLMRAKRLKNVLDSEMPRNIFTIPTAIDAKRTFPINDLQLRVSTIKPHVLVIMPSSDEMDDYYHFGIEGPVHQAGYLCERAENTSVDTDTVPDRDRSKSTYMPNLYKLISEVFDEEELRTLCFDMAVDYDTLRAEGKAGKARELVLHLSRRARVSELVNNVRNQRPEISLPNLLQHTISNQLLLEKVKPQVDTASFVIADMTNMDLNTLLIIGYAWGKEIPTILLIREGAELPFDLQGQRCLAYKRIRDLSETLSNELQSEVKTPKPSG